MSDKPSVKPDLTLTLDREGEYGSPYRRKRWRRSGLVKLARTKLG